MTGGNGNAIHLLCAGAAQDLIKALEAQLFALTGARVEGHFGAVGAMKEKLLGGERCDVMIVTAAMIRDLQEAGHLMRGTELDLGEVPTGIGVRAGEPLPDVSTQSALRSALLAASEIYFPDPRLATAGIHFASVLARLGIANQVEGRLRTFPNGATAMCELVARSVTGAIGCTQMTEINFTPGIECVAALPEGCALSTTYSAAVGARALQPEIAAAFVRLVAGPESSAIRRRLGFAVSPPFQGTESARR